MAKTTLPRPKTTTPKARPSVVLHGTAWDQKRAQTLREALARAGVYRSCDVTATSRHAAAVEHARESIAAAAVQLNANDAIALAGLIELLNAAPVDPALFNRMRARNDAIAAAAFAGQWHRPARAALSGDLMRDDAPEARR